MANTFQKAVLMGWLTVSVCGARTSWAQAIDVTDETQVEGAPAPEPTSAPAPSSAGEPAARKYFKARTPAQAPAAERSPANSGDRYLALSIGSFVSEDVYKWGPRGKSDVGQLDAGVTYKIGEWTNSMDLIFRANLTTYDLGEKDAVKLSLMPAITFPDVGSDFPLYFGGGAGFGVFFKQIPDESSLSFDYNLLVGARFLDLIEGVGFLIETGMKNHILLLSDGQFNGVYVNLGATFRF